MAIDILVVEDEYTERQELTQLLETVTPPEHIRSAATCSAAIAAISQLCPDLILLDVNLPGMSGFDICTSLRQRENTCPVIFLTSRTDSMDELNGMLRGGDDYITKPFRLKELLVRIKSVLRRYNRTGGDATVKIKNITINTNEAKVYKNGEEIVLTAMEYRLLLILLNNRGKVLSRSQLLENIWDVEGDFVEDNTLTVYIKRLRDKIEEDAASSQIIKTVRGLGYMIDNE